MELEASGLDVVTSRPRPEGAATNQPRASPLSLHTNPDSLERVGSLDWNIECCRSPSKIASLVVPRQGATAGKYDARS
jgi:hypothetical protein